MPPELWKSLIASGPLALVLGTISWVLWVAWKSERRYRAEDRKAWEAERKELQTALDQEKEARRLETKEQTQTLTEATRLLHRTTRELERRSGRRSSPPPML